jgi:regulator of replication initiation timing
LNNTFVIYINNENNGICYVDTDISSDSNWDWETDNDEDIMCNEIEKITYGTDYESVIWRIYFTNNWQLIFKNYYVTFEWIISELDDEKKEIYNDISKLLNWIEDISIENTDLKSSLDRLRKNLNNYNERSVIILIIKTQIFDWWIMIDAKQKELLDSILSRLTNE